MTAFAPGVKLPERVLGLSWTQIHLVLGLPGDDHDAGVPDPGHRRLRQGHRPVLDAAGGDRVARRRGPPDAGTPRAASAPPSASQPPGTDPETPPISAPTPQPLNPCRRFFARIFDTGLAGGGERAGKCGAAAVRCARRQRLCTLPRLVRHGGGPRGRHSLSDSLPARAARAARVRRVPRRVRGTARPCHRARRRAARARRRNWPMSAPGWRRCAS